MQDLLFTREEMVVSPAHNPSLSCSNCGLLNQCRTPRMRSVGAGKRGILIVGEWPTESDDRHGRPFSGRDGTFLRDELARAGIDMLEDCVLTHANRCRPMKGEPTDRQRAQCRKYLYRLIESINPKKIIPLGSAALKGLYGHRSIEIGAISKWAGAQIPDQELGTWVLPNWDIDYVRAVGEDNGAALAWFRRFLKNAVQRPDSFFFHHYDSDIEILREPRRIREVLCEMENSEVSAFDYETTGLKPYNEGHRIVSASVCSGDTGYAFMMHNPGVKDAFRSYLRSESKKIAHHIKFEMLWSAVVLGEQVRNPYWDTMEAAHILDNRKGITGLKHQTFVNLGISEYETELEQYLRAEKNAGANARNQIEKCPQSLLLSYGAQDALYTMRLYERQRERVLRDYPEAFDLMMRTQINFMEMELTGIRADRAYYRQRKQEVEARIEELERALREYPEVPDDFNPGSPVQINRVLYERFGYELPDGRRSSDDVALSKIDTPFARDLQAWRKWTTVQKRYLDGFLKEISDDGFLHCTFSTNTVSTYRSSSSNPNFQNIPKRDVEIMNIVRGGLYPKKGHRFMDLDFKSIEVSTSACYNQDPVLLKYVRDPSTDMHRDMACAIFFREEGDFESDDSKFRKLLKAERHMAKNGFVFPQFYGDYYGNNAAAIWDMMGDDTRAHLREHRIVTFDNFVQHMQKIEDRFWNTRFPVYSQWKESNWRKYQRRGLVDFYTGFRCGGIMRENQVNNVAIQGTAFHINLETIDYMVRAIEGWETRPMGQIHDSIVFSVPEEEREAILNLAREALEHVMQKHASWLIVPLTIEVEEGTIDGNWTTLEETESIRVEVPNIT